MIVRTFRNFPNKVAVVVLVDTSMKSSVPTLGGLENGGVIPLLWLPTCPETVQQGFLIARGDTCSLSLSVI